MYLLKLKSSGESNSLELINFIQDKVIVKVVEETSLAR